jgi:hypothetical protein
MLDIKGGRAAILAALIGFAALPAHAAPVLYQYTSGQATVTATSQLTTLGVATLNLNGIFAEFDSDTGMLTNFNFTTAPNQWITLTTVYGGFDQVWVNSASVVPGTGYQTLGTTEISPGHWSVSVMPVDVNAVWTGRNSITNATAGPFPLMYTNATPLNATIDVITGTFTLQGITLGVIPVPGENPVTVSAVLTFQGATPVPEPAAVGLVALAGVGLVLARSRA